MRRIARLIKSINLDLKYKLLNISTLKELTKID